MYTSRAAVIDKSVYGHFEVQTTEASMIEGRGPITHAYYTHPRGTVVVWMNASEGFVQMKCRIGRLTYIQNIDERPGITPREVSNLCRKFLLEITQK